MKLLTPILVLVLILGILAGGAPIVPTATPHHQHHHHHHAVQVRRRVIHRLRNANQRIAHLKTMRGGGFERTVVHHRITRRHSEIGGIVSMLRALRVKIANQMAVEDGIVATAHRKSKMAAKLFYLTEKKMQASQRLWLSAKQCYINAKAQRDAAAAHIHNEMHIIDKVITMMSCDSTTPLRSHRHGSKSGARRARRGTIRRTGHHHHHHATTTLNPNHNHHAVPHVHAHVHVRAHHAHSHATVRHGHAHAHHHHANTILFPQNHHHHVATPNVHATPHHHHHRVLSSANDPSETLENTQSAFAGISKPNEYTPATATTPSKGSATTTSTLDTPIPTTQGTTQSGGSGSISAAGTPSDKTDEMDLLELENEGDLASSGAKDTTQ